MMWPRKDKCQHDWRHTGLWLDSWSVREQCAKCGLVWDPYPPKVNELAAESQRAKSKKYAEEHLQKLFNDPSYVQPLIRSNENKERTLAGVFHSKNF